MKKNVKRWIFHITIFSSVTFSAFQKVLYPAGKKKLQKVFTLASLPPSPGLWCVLC